MRYNARNVNRSKYRGINMATEQFNHKLVAVLNKSVEAGKVMNALAHMCIGLGSAIGKEKLRLTDYKDADSGSHPFISEIPFIILSENANKIRKLRLKQLHIHFA